MNWYANTLTLTHTPPAEGVHNEKPCIIGSFSYLAFCLFCFYYNNNERIRGE